MENKSDGYPVLKIKNLLELLFQLTFTMHVSFTKCF